MKEQMSIIHELFYEQAKTTPDGVAVSHGPRQVTYRELNERSNQLAHFLRAQGVQRSEPIAIMVDKSVEMIISLFGILKAGAAFVPLDPTYPNDRLEMIFSDVEPKWMLTQHSYAQKVREFQGAASGQGLNVLFTDEADGSEADGNESVHLFGQLHEYSIEDLPVINEPDDMNYILFTSGSTGRPKGVMGCHKGLVHFVNWQVATFRLGPGDRVSQFAALTFDPCLRDIFTPLSSGATVCLPDRDTVLNRVALVNWLQAERITRIHCVPSLFRHFLSEVQTFAPEQQAQTFPHLKNIFLGGERLEAKYVRQWQDVFGERVELVNFYGPTEVTMIKLFHIIKDVPEEGKTVPIGKAIRGAVPLILNEKNKLCGIWQVGEICISSEYLALGYYKRPDLTAQVFVQNPLSKKPDRVYRTGDLGRYLPDGTIEYVGRKDFQIKVRGFRVELPEIETVLTEHPAMREVAVVARQDEAGDYTIVSYFTGDDAVTVDDLRAFVTQKLPEYMVPSQFHWLEQMPLNPNGKIDRKFLTDSMVQGKQLAATAYVAPRTETEQRIVAAWADVLKAERIGVKDNFFNIGGHSLLAMQIYARLREAANARLELKDLFEHQTVEALAAHIDSLGDAHAEAAVTVQDVQLKKQPQQASYELSHAQQRLWFLFKLEPHNIAYNMPFTLTMRGELDKSAFDQAFARMVERQDSLRTIFAEIDEQPRQIVLEKADVPVQHVDLSAAPHELEAHIARDLEIPFDLTAGPLVRAMLFQVGEAEYRFYLNIHHIISDGWSMGFFFQELGMLYGDEASLPPLELQYTDFALWQNEQLANGEMDKQERYWLNTLAKPLPVLNLPLDFERPAVQTYNGDAVRRTLTMDLLARVNEFAQREGTSLYMVLLSAYNLLLHQLTGDEDIIVGTPIAGRKARSLERIVGFFVNTLAVRTRFEGVGSFRELLAQVKERSLEAYENQDYPFDMLIERINPERDLSRSPIFSTMFVLHNMPFGLNFPGIDVEMNATDNRTAKFDLHLAAAEVEEGLGLLFTFNTDLLTGETVSNFAQQFEMLLEQIVEQAEAPLYAYNLLTERDRHILNEMNATDRAYDLDQTMIEAFVKQAEAHPERIALKYLGETVTYGELHERSNRIAHFLRAQGVQRNQLVAVMTERSIELLVGLYGVLKSGAAYVPVDPEYPAARVQYMITDCAAQVLLSKRAYEKEISEIAAGVELRTLVYLDPDDQPAPALEGTATYAWRDLLTCPAEMPELIATPTDLAYMIYTSGSTGQPKGVMIKHRAIINRFLWHQDTFQATPSDVAIQRTTQCFDDSISELFWPLRHGASLLIIPNEVVVDPERLIGHIVDDNVTYMQFVPSLFSIVVNYLYAMGGKCPQLPLTNIIVSGEALPTALVNKWFEMYPNGARLANLYGPTEAAIDVTSWLIDSQIGFVHIGKPISNTQIYIVNKHDKLCPVGVKGEVLVGGVQLAEGYHNKPEKTAEAFVPNFLPGTYGDTLYRTGDLARILPDGSIEYLGRIDNQVKVRGFRIELGEIEEVVTQHPDVEMAAVIVKKTPDGSTMLFGFYTTKHAGLEAAELKAFIGEKTPDYMVPSRIVKLDEMPITPNGKIDRKVLEGLAAEDAFGLEREYVAPSTPTQVQLAAIWSDVLQKENLSITDNFFELGGHSLLAIQIFNRISKEFNAKVQLKDLFTNSTLEKLAEYVDLQLNSGREQQQVVIPKAPSREHYELSHAQKRLWFLYKLDPTSSVYNVTSNIVIKSPLDVELFTEALQRIVARHDSLRTVFIEADGEPRQQVQAESSFALQIEDLRELDAQSRKRKARELVAAAEAQPFDLGRGPLMRAMLIQHAEGETQFYLSIHHIVTDGWSIEVFVRELSELYSALLHGRDPQLAPLPLQYTDYAEWQEQELQKGLWQADEHYWLNALAKPLPVLDLPTDLPRPDIQTFDGATHSAFVSKDLTERLRRLAKQEDASMFMLLLSTYSMLLHHLSNGEDIIIGTPSAGRVSAALEPLIGFFVNTLAIRTRFEGVRTLQDLLRQVKRQTLDAYEHQSYPFDLLIEKLNPERDMSRSPIFSTMFVYDENFKVEQSLGDLVVEPAMEELEHSISKFDITLFMTERDGQYEARFEYNTALFKKETVSRFAASFVKVLEAFVDRLTAPLAEIDLRTAEEQGLYARLNDTQRDTPTDRTVHELFYQIAAEHADRLAVSDDRRALTYRELNERSNQVAHLLREKGVAEGQIVGIMMGRSADIVIAILGALKAGAAYVPIDPEYPQERVRYMIEDSGTRVLLTERAWAEEMVGDGFAIIAFEDIPADLPTANLPVTTQASDIAYVIYTSGSTGHPKGTLLAHTGVANLRNFKQERVGYSENDVLLQFASFSFDAAVAETFSILLSGGRLHILVGEQRQSIDAFADAVEKQGGTTTTLPTVFFNQIGMHLEESALEKFRTMRNLIVAGEALQPQVVRAWQKRFGDRITIVNGYGPTEATVCATAYQIDALIGEEVSNLPIGTPVPNTQVYILNKHSRICPVGVVGEIHIAGIGLARGYLNQPEKTAEVFIPNPFAAAPDALMYKTGDMARLLPSGLIEYVGRADAQVKVRGHRVEIGEIEEVMLQHPGVRFCAVLPKKDSDGTTILVAYYTATEADAEPGAIKKALGDKLPAYMIPSIFRQLDELPLLPNGKVDRKELAKQAAQEAAKSPRVAAGAANELQEKIIAVWAQALQLDPGEVGIHDNFFDIGGHSLLLTKVHAQLKKELATDIAITELFKHPTVKTLADALMQADAQHAAAAPQLRAVNKQAEDNAVAIIGMSLRYPDAKNPWEFWQNLRGGLESIREFPLEELEPTPFNQDPEIQDELVRMCGYLADVDKFDPSFFGMSEKEALMMDPQHRLFLQCCWEAVEDAGYDVDSIQAPVSVYGGVGSNEYLTLQSVLSGSISKADMFQASLSNAPKFLTTRVSYKLNLTGESMLIDTACSTSLFAVHMAAKSLLTGDADFALAGGVSIQMPQKKGYVYEPGFIYSEDGRCRAFDKDATGTTVGSGVGVVFLKRLADAKRDGDPIYAVIKGSAINNDGNLKVGYSAPSESGQTEVIIKALQTAGVSPETVTYVEAHGTATALGDPIEVAALTQAYRRLGARGEQYCGLGSVKSNIGHTDAAAGVAGLIKVALSLKHGELPPSLHYREPNPAIDFASSPFYVNHELKAWPAAKGPRRAGVSSFGIGGTNAHVILEEAPSDDEQGN